MEPKRSETHSALVRAARYRRSRGRLDSKPGAAMGGFGGFTREAAQAGGTVPGTGRDDPGRLHGPNRAESESAFTCAGRGVRAVLPLALPGDRGDRPSDRRPRISALANDGAAP